MQKKIIIAGFTVSFVAIIMNLAWDAFSRNSPPLYNLIIGLIFTAFSLLHGARYFGRLRIGVLFSVTTIVSFIMEYIGVTTGVIYGDYVYGDSLGPKILDTVPLLIPCSWFMFMYGASIISNEALAQTSSLREFLRRKGGAPQVVVFAVFDSIAMTALDIILDPISVHKGAWKWTSIARLPDERVFYGIPAQNYFGWLLTTFMIFIVFRAVFFRAGVEYEEKDGLYFLPAVNYAAIFVVGTIQAWTLLGNTGIIFVSISTVGLISLMGMYRMYVFYRGGT